MAFNYNTIVSGTDILLTKINGLITKLNGYLNAIPGSALLSGTVPKTALQHKKSVFSVLFQYLAFGAANIQNIGAMTLINLDGASSSTWRIVGYSFAAGTSGSPINKVPGAQLLVKVAGVTQITILLDAAALAVGTPLTAAGLSVSATSGQTISVDYVGAAAASYPFANLYLYMTQDHVAN